MANQIIYKNSSSLRKPYTGRIRISIPVSYTDFNKDPAGYLKKYMGTIKENHDINVREINYLEEYKRGIQDIFKKTKADGSENINNKIVINFAYEFVKFKTGYYAGKPINYICNTDNAEEMLEFNSYIRKINKASKDVEKYNKLLTHGVCYTFTCPNRNVEDEEDDSPFEYEVLDSTKVCTVYSGDEISVPLCSIIFSTQTNDNGTTINTYSCYCNYKVYILTDETLSGKKEVEVKNQPSKQPITEYTIDYTRMGVFEPVLSSLNSCNTVRSNQLDDIESFVNAWIVFLNQNPDYIKQNMQEIKKARMLALKTNNPNTPADVKMLQSSLNHSGINSTFNDIKQDTFNIVGVPMATSSTGQGVSGTSQQYGSGWENAQTYADVDTNFIVQFERKDLEKFIQICKESTIGKIKNIKSKDIEIKFTINKSNDLLVKAQSFKYLVDLGVPYDSAFQLTQLSDDSKALGTRSEKNFIERTKQVNDLEVEKEKQIYENEKKFDKEYSTDDNDSESDTISNQDSSNQDENINEDNQDNKDI